MTKKSANYLERHRDPNKFHGFPVLIQSETNIRYMATSFNEGWSYAINPISPLLRFTIREDEMGNPGDILHSTEITKNYFPDQELFSKMDEKYYGGLQNLSFQVYLGNGGIEFTAGQKIWIVYEFDKNFDNGANGHSPVGHSSRKTSSDGINWADYQGNANGRYSDQMPMLLMTD